jgi:anti-anti-sigma factor
MADSDCVSTRVIEDVTVVTFTSSSIVDAAEAERVGQQLYTLLDDPGCRKIVLSLANVRAMSSLALGVLVSFRQKVADCEGRVLVCDVGDQFNAVLRACRLDTLFAFCTDEREALARFGVAGTD